MFSLNKLLTVALIASLLLFSCGSDEKIVATTEADLEAVPTYNKEGTLQAVIEIPAGTNHKIEYNKESKAFTVDQKEGKDRIINFLPYPGNYGFIPSTYMNPEQGGDGDALDILVLSESQPTGTVMQVIPIALFRMKDAGELDSKVIAIPANEELRVFDIQDYEAFNKEFVKAKLIVEYWFTSYKGNEGQVDNIHWQDAQAARREVNRWALQ